MLRKCALIVDDSKSAQFVLGKLLKEHGLDVDTAESAEEALDYLIRKRPDAIFMDHLMPGMDGFQAVKAIKSNPNTATIPIMMYTSQQGEVYVGQARALGAVGVLPKQTKQVEVSNVLKSLNLIPKAPAEAPVTAAPPAAKKPEAPAPARRPPPVQKPMRESLTYAKLRDLIEEVLADQAREQRQELKKDVLASYDIFAKRVISELRPQKQRDASLPPPAVEQRFPWSTVLGAGALAVLALVLVGLYIEARNNLASVTEENARLRVSLNEQITATATQAEQLAELQKTQLSAAEAESRQAIDSIEWGVNQGGQYPYGEIPLGDERVEAFRELISRLAEVGFQGTLRIETHSGIFCLVGEDASGFRPAGEEVRVNECKMRGNPVEDALAPGEHQSVAFANFLATSELLQGEDIQVEVVSVGPQRPLLDYPIPTSDLTAGEWNRIAALNNRVEISLFPQP
jgi:CheY-like chemotaxis protein